MNEPYTVEPESTLDNQGKSGGTYPPEIVAAFPPLFESDSQGSSYLVRFCLLGLVFGLLAALSIVQLQWWASITLGVLWLLGMTFLGILAPLRAKRHRSGVGYLADPAAWIKTYGKVINVGVAIFSILSLAIAAATELFLFNASTARSFNYTPLVLLLGVLVLTVFTTRWLLNKKILWLIYGGR